MSSNTKENEVKIAVNDEEKNNNSDAKETPTESNDISSGNNFSNSKEEKAILETNNSKQKTGKWYIVLID